MPVTERLYYRDPALMSFEAQVQEQIQVGAQYRVRLDRSAFYPTSGGQLFDHGTLNGVPVVEVIEAEDGEVWHISAQPVATAGTAVTGEVDKTRRQKNRQQHTAQHVLSALCVKRFGYETVSVHLGEEYGAIELDTASIDPKQLSDLEILANGVIQDNLPVEIIFAEGDQIAALPLRKMPERTGPLRVIRMADLDCSACGGTHCTSTSEVGLIKLIGVERVRAHLLIRFLSGALAQQDYRNRFEVTDLLSKNLTCAVADLPSVVVSLGEDNKSLRKEVGSLQKELLPIRAAALARTAQLHGSYQIVSSDASSMEPALAGQLAGMAADNVKGVALILADGRLVLAVAADTGLHAGELAKKLGPICNLRGGGSNRVAQLGGTESSRLNEYKDALIGLLPHE
jgi:alanyl-tRNA synthetase